MVFQTYASHLLLLEEWLFSPAVTGYGSLANLPTPQVQHWYRPPGSPAWPRASQIKYVILTLSHNIKYVKLVNSHWPKVCINSVWTIPRDVFFQVSFLVTSVVYRKFVREVNLLHLFICSKEAPSSASEEYRGLSHQRPRGFNQIRLVLAAWRRHLHQLIIL